MTITTITTTMATASTLRDIYRQLEHPYQADFTNCLCIYGAATKVLFHLQVHK